VIKETVKGEYDFVPIAEHPTALQKMLPLAEVLFWRHASHLPSSIPSLDKILHTSPMHHLFIGLPVYNGERFLREAIDSLLAQSHKNLTLYISDDASTDETQNICTQYAAQDARVVYHRQPQNLGMFSNFKFVLDAAAGDYFMWAAQDDVRDQNYAATCIEALEKNKALGLATTAMALIDTFGRVLATETEAAQLSGAPSMRQVARYVMQLEGLGKCNLMYGMFRTSAAHAVWRAYPQRKVWGQDYLFSLALISRFAVHIDPAPLFKKRLGGYSSPQLLLGSAAPVQLLTQAQRRNTFPFKRFAPYFAGHMEALRGTPYQPLVLLLLLRLPRSLYVYLAKRNYKKFIRRLLTR